jgi:hypothetical protein
MVKVLRFTEYLTESINDTTNIVNVVLHRLEDSILDLLLKYEAAYQKQFEREMSEYDRELARLTIIFDMIRAIEIYTQPTDTLVDVRSYTSAKGNLEISAQIQRDSQVYNFVTEVIYAGGYNIQRLHYRYITKTDLPKTNNTKVGDAYQEKIKKLSKLEKLNNEILSLENQIQTLQQTVELNKAKTEAQIWQEIKTEKDYYEWPTWSEIIKRGADKNYNDEEDFITREKQDKSARIDFWKRKNIKWKEDQILAYQKQIVKAKKKLESLI